LPSKIVLKTVRFYSRRVLYNEIMYYISCTTEMNNWDAWSVGEEVDWKTLEHITFDTEEAAQAYVKELQRLDRKNGIKHRYAINEK